MIKGLDFLPPSMWPSWNDSTGHYNNPCYEGKWDAQNGGMTPARAASTRDKFDLHRFFISADPILDALTPGAVNDPDELINIKMLEVRRSLDIFDKVDVCLTPNEQPKNPNFSRLAICDGGVNEARYHDALSRLTLAIKTNFVSRRVCIEHDNETVKPEALAGAGYDDWNAIQLRRWETIRKITSTHTVVLQPHSYGFPQYLKDIDTSPFDARTMYWFHPYYPGHYFQQGTGTAVGSEYLYGLSWPISETPGGKAAVKALAAQRVAASSLSASAKAEMTEYLNGTWGVVDYLYAEDFKDGWFDRKWAEWGIYNWIDAQGINPRQVAVGEFGVASDHNWNGKPGMSTTMRARVIADLARTAQRRGMFGFILHQMCGDLNLMQQTSVNQQGDTYIPEIVAAMEAA